MHKRAKDIMKAQFEFSDLTFRHENSSTKGKISRHTSLRKSLNFYPTALFAEGVLAIPHYTHLHLPIHTNRHFAKAKECNLANPHFFVLIIYTYCTINLRIFSLYRFFINDFRYLFQFIFLLIPNKWRKAYETKLVY